MVPPPHSNDPSYPPSPLLSVHAEKRRSRQASNGSTILSRILSKGSNILFGEDGGVDVLKENEIDPTKIDLQFRNLLIDALPEGCNKKQIIEEQMKQQSIRNKISIIKSSTNRNTLFHYLTLLESSPTRGDINSLRIEFSHQPLNWLSDFQKQGGTSLLLGWIRADSPIIKELMMALKAYTNNTVGLEDLVKNEAIVTRLSKLVMSFTEKPSNLDAEHKKQALGIALNILSVVAYRQEYFSIVNVIKREWTLGKESFHPFKLVIQEHHDLLADFLLLGNSLIENCSDFMERIHLRWELFPSSFKTDYQQMMMMSKKNSVDDKNDDKDDEDDDDDLKIQYEKFINHEKDDLSLLADERFAGDTSMMFKEMTEESNKGVKEGIVRLLQCIHVLPAGMKEGITKLLIDQLRAITLNSFQTTPLTLEAIDKAFKTSEEERKEHQASLTRLRMDNLSKEGQYRLEIDSLQRKNEVLEDKVEDLVSTLKSYKEEIGDINRDALLEISMLKGDIARLEKIEQQQQTLVSIVPSTTTTTPHKSSTIPPPPPQPLNAKISAAPPAPVNPKKSAIPPPPPPPSMNCTKRSPQSFAPPPPPPPPPQMMMKPVQPTISLPKPTVQKLKPMQWRKLTPKELPNSIWMEIGSIAEGMIGMVSFQEIDTLFQQQQLKRSASMLSISGFNGENNDHQNKQQQQTLDSFISTEERMMISIILMKITSPIPSLIKAINEMDSAIFTNNLSYQLRKSFEDEKFSNPLVIKGLQMLKGTSGRDDRCEELLLGLAQKVPQFPIRIKVLNLREEEFPEACNQILSLMAPYQQLFKEISESESFKKCLTYILIIGNYVNQGSIRGDARGFSIEYLTSLRPLRANAPSSMTMLQYIEQSGPFSMKDLESIHSILVKTSKWSEVERHFNHLKEIKETITSLPLLIGKGGGCGDGDGVVGGAVEIDSVAPNEYLSKYVDEFVSASTRQLATIQDRWARLKKERDNLLVQYPSTTGIDNLLGIFTEFIGDLRRGRRDSLKITSAAGGGGGSGIGSTMLLSPTTSEGRGVIDDCLDHLRGRSGSRSGSGKTTNT